MLNKLLNSGQAKLLTKKEQQTVTGGVISVPLCQFGTPTCCGDQSWQCGTGDFGGGDYINGICYCYA